MIEAIKQARQIIWRYRHETPLGNQPHMIAHEADEVIERIDQALETKDEPVAWRYDQAKYRTNDLRGRQWAFNVFSQTKPYIDEMVQNVTPLYTTPQRTWVGLTNEEIYQDLLRSPYALQSAGAWREGVAWAEEILKRKNYE